MISVHRPGLRFGQANHRENNFLSPESRLISLSTARTTSSILSLAEIIDINAIRGSPFIDQAVEMAGLVFIAEMRLPAEPALPNDAGLSGRNGPGVISHQTNYHVCRRTLQLLMIYWRGIAWILTAMEQKHSGLQETDPGETSVDPYSWVQVGDRKMIEGLLKRVHTDPKGTGSQQEQAENSKYRDSPCTRSKIAYRPASDDLQQSESP